MTFVSASVEIAASPDRVWDVVTDPRSLPRLDRRIFIVSAPPKGLEPGAEYTAEVRFLGVRARIHARALEARRPNYARVRLTGLLDATMESTLTSLDAGDRTRLEHRVQYRFKGGPLGRMAERAVGKVGPAAVLRRGAQAQKRQVEESVG